MTENCYWTINLTHGFDKLWTKLSKLTDKINLYLYSKLKTDITLEDYLKSENSFKLIQLSTMFSFKSEFFGN